MGGGARGFASRIGPLSKLIASSNTYPPTSSQFPKIPVPTQSSAPFPTGSSFPALNRTHSQKEAAARIAKPHPSQSNPAHYLHGPARRREAPPSSYDAPPPVVQRPTPPPPTRLLPAPNPPTPRAPRVGDLGRGDVSTLPRPASSIRRSVRSRPLPPSPIPPHSGGRAGRRVRARGVRRSLRRGRGRRPRGDARGCCGCSAGGSSLSGWDGRGAGGPRRAEPGVRASWLLSVPRSLPPTPASPPRSPADPHPGAPDSAPALL